jgi:hypothetical protein
MVQAAFVQFVLLAVGLSLLVFFLITGQNLFEVAASTTSTVKDRPYITVVNYGVTLDRPISQSKIGDDFEYRLSVRTMLALNQQKEDVTIVPVLIYKGVEKRIQYSDGVGNLFDTFTIKKGESANSYVFKASILSSISPLQKILPSGTRLFMESWPYYFEDMPGSGSNFKIWANQIMPFTMQDNAGNAQEVCTAQFIVECKDAIRISDRIKKCDDASRPDEKCRDSLELCGATVTLTIVDINCADRNVAVAYEAKCSECTQWDVNEIAVINFFKVDTLDGLINPNACVYREESNYEQKCYPDFLGNAVLKFGPFF